MLKNNKNYGGNVHASTNGNPDVDNYLKNYGVDIDRYLPVGAKVEISEDEPDKVKIICVDKNKSNEVSDYFVTILIDEVDDPLEVMDIFKSVDATIIHSSYELDNVVIHKNYTIDENRKNNREKMDED